MLAVTGAGAQTLSGGSIQLHEGGFVAASSAVLSDTTGSVRLERGTLGEVAPGPSTGTNLQLRGGVLHAVLSDTDGDNWDDAIEIAFGTDVLDAASNPGASAFAARLDELRIVFTDPELDGDGGLPPAADDLSASDAYDDGIFAAPSSVLVGSVAFGSVLPGDEAAGVLRMHRPVVNPQTLHLDQIIQLTPSFGHQPGPLSASAVFLWDEPSALELYGVWAAGFTGEHVILVLIRNTTNPDVDFAAVLFEPFPSFRPFRVRGFTAAELAGVSEVELRIELTDTGSALTPSACVRLDAGSCLPLDNTRGLADPTLPAFDRTAAHYTAAAVTTTRPAVPDQDGDTHNGLSDNCPVTPNPTQANLDGDKFGDACDHDIDGDGVLNQSDAFPNDAAATTDTDGDGQPDSLNGSSTTGLVEDTDDDDDGVSDTDEDLAGTNSLLADSDGDGVCDGALFSSNPLVGVCAEGPDAFPNDPGETSDTDGDGVGDGADDDDDGDGLPDDADQDPLDAASCRTKTPEVVLVWHDPARIEPGGSTPLKTPFGLSVHLDPLGQPVYDRAPGKQHLLAARANSVQEQVRAGIEQAFADAVPLALAGAGKGTLSVTTLSPGAPVPSQGVGSAAVVYLVDRDAVFSDLDDDGFDDFGDVGGVAWDDIDRFNRSCEGGEAAVFVSSFDAVAGIVQKVVHEVGHLYGLRHIYASDEFSAFKASSCSAGGFDPSASGAMDYSHDRSDFTFGECGAVGCVVAEPPDCRAVDSGDRHNPRYHFLRYVLGYSDAQLLGQGIVPVPGSWDDGATDATQRFVEFRFQFGPATCAYTIHDVRIQSQCSSEHGEETLYFAQSIQLCALDQLKLAVAETCAIRLEAKKQASDPNPTVMLAQVPSADWVPEEFQPDGLDVGSQVPIRQEVDGPVVINTILLETLVDAATGDLSVTVPDVCSATDACEVGLEPLWDLREDGLYCDRPAGCDGQQQGDQLTEGFAFDNPPPPALIPPPVEGEPSPPLEADADGDGIFDSLDNCLLKPNPTQVDSDKDGYGNRCDADYPLPALDPGDDCKQLIDPETGKGKLEPTGGDGKVGSPDFTTFARAFGTSKDDPLYLEFVDCGGANTDALDGIVGGPEFTCFANAFNNGEAEDGVAGGPGPSGRSCVKFGQCERPIVPPKPPCVPEPSP